MLDHVGDGDDLILGLGSGEPPTVLDALEAAASTGIGLAGAVAREPSG